jgi:hypothetical protein
MKREQRCNRRDQILRKEGDGDVNIDSCLRLVLLQLAATSHYCYITVNLEERRAVCT